MASRSMASLLAWLPALAVAAANDCDVAVVGGGWAGLYTAYRLAPTTPNLCLFEARHKTGGRTTAREEHNLTIDIGAPTAPRPEFNTTLYKIVDGDAAENAAGYETPLRLITRDLVARGVRVEYGRELVALKVYLVYPEPWWRTELGILEGSFAATNSSPPFFGRFHDGPMLRDAAARFGAGAIETATRSTKGRPATVAPPTSAVMGFWDASNKFLPTPMSSNFRAMLKTCRRDPASAAQTATLHTMKTRTRRGKKNLFVANNDYWFTGYQGTPCCWAEQSLKVAEHILKTHFALPKPAWLDEAYYRDQVSAL
ncbi:flavin containing amine oxidoreductase [Aureococcus anophagefferens]|nr:flavin containing amine oxidoreductase [Aureococcus anophagefferens]